MTKTGLVYSPKYLWHKTEPRHPEVPSRLRVIMRELKKSGILENKNAVVVEPETASINDLKLVHDVGYIHVIKQVCSCGGGMIDEDTVVSSKSYEVARLAAGGVLKAVDLVINKKCSNGFAFVRPPGHHAGFNYPMGFCVFNNVAVAAAHLVERVGLERVLILDIDAHHGNGTQELFYNNKKVLYISMHEDPIEFPLKGFADEAGEGKGTGYTVNVPLPYGAGTNCVGNTQWPVSAPTVTHPIIIPTHIQNFHCFSNGSFSFIFLSCSLIHFFMSSRTVSCRARWLRRHSSLDIILSILAPSLTSSLATSP